MRQRKSITGGGRELEPVSPKSTEWKGPEEVTQTWTEINNRRRQKAMGRVGCVGGITLSVDYLYNGQLPHRSQDD